MSLTIKEILKRKKEVESEINTILTKFEKESELSVGYVNRRTYDYKGGKEIKLKNPTVRIEVNIENDPRSL